jgi:hypothetical protein
VVTDRQFITELEEACRSIWATRHARLEQLERALDERRDDELVIRQAVSLLEELEIADLDPRTRYAISCVTRGKLKVFWDAPVVIFIGCNNRLSCPEMNAGICGAQMSLAAASLGLGVCWSNLGRAVNAVPETRAKLGFEEPWEVKTSLCLGYPAFKQEGVVPRAFRPIIWFRSGSGVAEVEE